MWDLIVLLSGSWPMATVLITLVLGLLFRGPIGRLIDRTRSVSKEGIRAYDDAQLSARRPEGLTEFLEGFQSPLLLAVEAYIEKDLQDGGFTDPAHVRKVLLKRLAGVLITAHFEDVQRIIFASQLEALDFLCEQFTPTPKDTLKNRFYDKAVTVFPMVYKNRSFDTWLGYLREQDLVDETAEGISLSVRGREFLKWRVGSGRPGPLIG